jgi:hypothetical protein
MQQQPGRYSCEHSPMSATGSRSTHNHSHSGQGMCDRALVFGAQQPEVERYVIEVDGHRCSQSRDVEATRHVDEARQGQQAQGCGGQMGDFIEWASAQETKLNPAVGRVKANATPASTIG